VAVYFTSFRPANPKDIGEQKIHTHAGVAELGPTRKPGSKPFLFKKERSCIPKENHYRDVNAGKLVVLVAAWVQIPTPAKIHFLAFQ